MKTQVLIIGLILSMALIVGCEKQQIIGGDKDEHGCIGSAGYSWCETKQKCLRVWEENCTAEGCGTCPQLVAPAPGFCAGGTIAQKKLSSALMAQLLEGLVLIVNLHPALA
jgi:hypothetical protein